MRVTSVSRVVGGLERLEEHMRTEEQKKLEAEFREMLAQAWDECYSALIGYFAFPTPGDTTPPKNPYRVER